MGNPVVSKSKSVGTHPAKPLKTLFGAILGEDSKKKTSQRSLLFRQNVNRTEEEWRRVPATVGEG